MQAHRRMALTLLHRTSLERLAGREADAPSSWQSDRLGRRSTDDWCSSWASASRAPP